MSVVTFHFGVKKIKISWLYLVRAGLHTVASQSFLSADFSTFSTFDVRKLFANRRPTISTSKPRFFALTTVLLQCPVKIDKFNCFILKFTIQVNMSYMSYMCRNLLIFLRNWSCSSLSHYSMHFVIAFVLQEICAFVRHYSMFTWIVMFFPSQISLPFTVGIWNPD